MWGARVGRGLKPVSVKLEGGPQCACVAGDLALPLGGCSMKGRCERHVGLVWNTNQGERAEGVRAGDHAGVGLMCACSPADQGHVLVPH